MIERGILGNVVRSEDDVIIVRIPGDEVVVSVRKKLESSGDVYESGDEVVIMSVPVNRWIIVGKMVDV